MATIKDTIVITTKNKKSNEEGERNGEEIKEAQTDRNWGNSTDKLKNLKKTI